MAMKEVEMNSLIRRLKDKSGMGYMKLSKATGIGENNLCRIVNGKMKLTIRSAVVILDAMGYEILVHKIGDPPDKVIAQDQKGDWRQRQINPSQDGHKKKTETNPTKD